MSKASEQRNSYFHSALLLLTATIWGFAFVAQQVGMDHVGPITFVAGRGVLATIALTPVVLFMRKRERNAGKTVSCDRGTFWLGSISCGVLLFLGLVTQQIGLLYTTVGKAGFITTIYVILVPILGIVLGRSVGLRIWLAVLLAVAGLYFLCMQPGEFSLGRGETIVLLCAIVYTFQITLVGHFVDYIGGVMLSYMQIVVATVLGVIAALIFEEPTMGALINAALPLLYAGVMSTAMGFTLQSIGQVHVSPTIASLIMSMESAISAFAGWLLLGDVLSSREFLGCALMMAGIVIAQLPNQAFARLFHKK